MKNNGNNVLVAFFPDKQNLMAFGPFSQALKYNVHHSSKVKGWKVFDTFL